MTDACWNRIGVHGDGTCPELERHVHCRNCPVYSSAAQTLLDRESSAADLAAWTSHFARPKAIDAQGTQSVLIFRVATEWLALPTRVVKEVAELRPVHSLPHRRGGDVLGVANIRGELLVCVSLARLLGLEPSPPGAPAQAVVHQRLLVIRRDDVRAVCPTDEVDGIHRVHPRDLREAPATVAQAAGRHSTSVLPWKGRTIGVLDEGLLFHALQRSLA